MKEMVGEYQIPYKPRVKSKPVMFYVTPEDKRKLILAAKEKAGGNISWLMRKLLEPYLTGL